MTDQEIWEEAARERERWEAAAREADATWDGKAADCPRCGNTFKAPNRRQCLRCGLIFFASNPTGGTDPANLVAGFPEPPHPEQVMPETNPPDPAELMPATTVLLMEVLRRHYVEAPESLRLLSLALGDTLRRIVYHHVRMEVNVQGVSANAEYESVPWIWQRFYSFRERRE